MSVSPILVLTKIFCRTSSKHSSNLGDHAFMLSVEMSLPVEVSNTSVATQLCRNVEKHAFVEVSKMTNSVNPGEMLKNNTSIKIVENLFKYIFLQFSFFPKYTSSSVEIYIIWFIISWRRKYMYTNCPPAKDVSTVSLEKQLFAVRQIVFDAICLYHLLILNN